MQAQTLCWPAHLTLGFSHSAGRTWLSERRHAGPLRVQKTLYPEGQGTCHAVLLHPPGGIAGGDTLKIDVTLAPQSRVLLTTPGAGKWYRSEGLAASQAIGLNVGAGACLEWLPQETIVFDGATAASRLQLDLAADAVCLGWDMVCLGRPAAGETFTRGSWNQMISIRRAGKRVWLEQGRIDGGDAVLAAPTGLAGQPVFGTFWAASPAVGPLAAALLKAGRELAPDVGLYGITELPDLLLARYLGSSAQAGRAWFAALWALWRPALLGQDAIPPRIWNT